jgi:transcription-repair coupling factor (superfamily II helicase)
LREHDPPVCPRNPRGAGAIPAFDRVRRHLSLATGRRRVSGLTATARALYIPLFARAAKEPVIVVVPDNKAAEALELALRAGCELTGAIDPKRVLRCRRTMCCRLKISRRIRIFRSSAPRCLWKFVTGAASIVIAPVEAVASPLSAQLLHGACAEAGARRRDRYRHADRHLASVGYTQVDLVEMPGQFARRGGILDVYSPRPIGLFASISLAMRSSRFASSIRRRSALQRLWMRRLLLPLTETPATEKLLAAVHARLSRQRVEDDADSTRSERTRLRYGDAQGVTIFPGWEFFALRRGSGYASAQACCRAARSLSKSRRWCATRSSAGGTRSSSAMIAPDRLADSA